MPELPEVETIRGTLEQLIIGKTIADVRVKWANIIKKPDDIDRFKMKLIGETIEKIERRGKFLLFQMTNITMVSHLRMEGKYGLFHKDDAIAKHTHVLFTFTDGTELRYNDVRKFGTMHLFEKGTAYNTLPLSQLGVEPLTKQFTVNVLKNAFQKTTRNIKVVLLDQKVVVGLGNIYVDESLYYARIHPERKAASLSDDEIARLHEAIITILNKAVTLGGATIKSYESSDGEMGMFQQELAVYGRKEKPCYTCGHTITRIVVGGRGTHFCASCQK